MFAFEKNDKSITSENYRTLRTNIEYFSKNNGLKTILITSSQPEDGKTTVAGNLALSLVEVGKKVVLVDCDLRRPAIHKYLNIGNRAGVSEIIIDNVSVETAVQECIKGLDIITSGRIPSNPSEILDSDNMERLLKNLKENYDYVILDSPAILEVADAQILSSKVDGTILVARLEKTKKNNIINAGELLNQVKANIIGTVLNRVKTKHKSYYREKKSDLRRE